MERTIDEIKKHLAAYKIDYNSITHDSSLMGTTLENWVYYISIRGDWKEHVRLRMLMSELGYVETDRKVTESDGGDWYEGEHRFSLWEGVELFK